jgi:hypothetical protein
MTTKKTSNVKDIQRRFIAALKRLPAPTSDLHPYAEAPMGTKAAKTK